VYRAREPLRVRNLTDYSGEPVREGLPEGTYVVSLDQPLHRLLRALLEPKPEIPDTLFYDISAWSLPLAFGVEGYLAEGPTGGRLELLREAPRPAGSVVEPDATYAFLVSWERNAAPRALAFLQASGVRVHFTTREFETAGRVFSPGSLVIFRGGNPADLPDLLQAAAAAHPVEFVGVNSGLTERGPDLGSSRVRYLEPVRVALLAGEPAMATSVGACWFLLDRVVGLPHSLIGLDEITGENLDDYEVLVFPDEWSGGEGYLAALDSTGIRAIAQWVQDGGVFVGLGGGAFFASRDLAGLGSVALAPDPDEDADRTEEDREAADKAHRLETRLERERRLQLEDLPGTIFGVEVDPQHPLGFGYRGAARVLKISDRALELGPPGTNAAVFADRPRVSGYASDAMRERFLNRPFALAEPVGRGTVAFYVEDPNFRLFWSGLTRLFLNSVVFLPSLD
jgi:hypothetical protein